MSSDNHARFSDSVSNFKLVAGGVRVRKLSKLENESGEIIGCLGRNPLITGTSLRELIGTFVNTPYYVRETIAGQDAHIATALYRPMDDKDFQAFKKNTNFNLFDELPLDLFVTSSRYNNVSIWDGGLPILYVDPAPTSVGGY